MSARLPALVACAAALVAASCGSSPAPPAPTRSSAPASQGPGGTVITPTAETPAAAPAQEVNPAGDIPDNQVFVVYTLPSGAFSVRVPEGWARSESGGAVTFTDRYNSIRLETVAAAAAPTVDSARRDELPAIRRANPGMSGGDVGTVTRSAGPAILITYQASSAQNPVTGKVARVAVERYEFWRGGTEAIVTLSAPVGSDNVDPWRTVTDGFRWP